MIDQVALTHAKARGCRASERAERRGSRYGAPSMSTIPPTAAGASANRSSARVRAGNALVSNRSSASRNSTYSVSTCSSPRLRIAPRVSLRSERTSSHASVGRRGGWLALSTTITRCTDGSPIALLTASGRKATYVPHTGMTTVMRPTMPESRTSECVETIQPIPRVQLVVAGRQARVPAQERVHFVPRERRRRTRPPPATQDETAETTGSEVHRDQRAVGDQPLFDRAERLEQCLRREVVENLRADDEIEWPGGQPVRHRRLYELHARAAAEALPRPAERGFRRVDGDDRIASRGEQLREHADRAADLKGVRESPLVERRQRAPVLLTLIAIRGVAPGIRGVLVDTFERGERRAPWIGLSASGRRASALRARGAAPKSRAPTRGAGRRQSSLGAPAPAPAGRTAGIDRMT